MMHDDDKFNEWVHEAGQTYNAPPDTPRDQLWQRIAAERQRRAERVIELRPWARWTLAAAAVLVLGIGIGRWTAGSRDPGEDPGVLAMSDTAGQDVAYDVAATRYLSRTETFLTAFRADLGSGRTDGRFADQARQLLTTTRLMLDSPAADDPRRRALLESLELLLVQIAQLDAARGGTDAELITDGMDQTNVLPRLRSAIPAGPVAVRTQGVL